MMLETDMQVNAYSPEELALNKRLYGDVNGELLVLDFYQHINTLNFEKGYISEEVFENIKALGTRLFLAKPKIWWK